MNFPEGFDDVYLIECLGHTLNDLHLQQEEVQDARWAGLDEIERMLDRGEFIPYYRDLIRLWFSMRSRRGSTTAE